MALSAKDFVKQSVTTGGTGTLTLGAAQATYQALGAADDGLQFCYAIKDGNDRETGSGTYTHSTTTFTRTTRTASTTGAALNVSTSAEFFIDWTTAGISAVRTDITTNTAAIAAMHSGATGRTVALQNRMTWM